MLFDNAGNPMVRTHATKQGVRYRYYVSRPYLRGIVRPPTGAIMRVPAADLEAAVTKALRSISHLPSTVPAKKGSAEQKAVSQTSLGSRSGRTNWRSG